MKGVEKISGAGFAILIGAEKTIPSNSFKISWSWGALSANFVGALESR